jgi:ketosteroid isomerase-like protein
MSRKNVEIVRAIMTRGSVITTPHLTTSRRMSSGTSRQMSLVETSRTDVRLRVRSLSGWIGMWSDYRYELRELIDAGDHVFAAGWQSGRGKGSGVETSEEIFSVWTLRGGKAVEQRMFRDRAQALEAAGLSE